MWQARGRLTVPALHPASPRTDIRKEPKDPRGRSPPSHSVNRRAQTGPGVA